MMRMKFKLAVLAAVFFPAACAVAAPAATMPTAMAREVVGKTVELVERRGLYPRRQAEYDQAKAALLATFDGQPVDIDRTDLHARIMTLLRTLDTNGHSFIIPADRPLTVRRRQAAPDDLAPPTFQLLKTPAGTVLRWTPPPIVGGGAGAIAPYLKRFHEEAQALPEIAEACALVVDLSEQSGGNGWPPFVAMYPLFGDANKANWVDRDDRRTAMVDRARLAGMDANASGGRVHPLARFATGPLAVVTSKRTASAGEMLLIALLGEARVRTFGQTTAGMTTGNTTHALADGSTLVLTQTRYALGAGPVYRGGVDPMQRTPPGGTFNDGLAMATGWVATNSQGCRAANGATAD